MNELPITEFDMVTLPESIQMIKAAIPFLNYDYQKTLSVIIRSQELMKTINFYKKPVNLCSFKCCSASKPVGSLDDLISNPEFLSAVLKYCPSEYANMLKNFKDFQKMYDMFGTFENGMGGFNNFMDAGASNLYKQYTEELNKLNL